eukprot:COSAG06_NODE_7412_length_2513_cov_2.458161_1_plen_59_part_10
MARKYERCRPLICSVCAFIPAADLLIYAGARFARKKEATDGGLRFAVTLLLAAVRARAR